MYTDQITIPIATDEQVKDFHRKHPLFKTDGIPISFEDLTAALAVFKMNGTLRSYQCVTRITDKKDNGDGTYSSIISYKSYNNNNCWLIILF